MRGMHWLAGGIGFILGTLFGGSIFAWLRGLAG